MGVCRNKGNYLVCVPARDNVIFGSSFPRLSQTRDSSVDDFITSNQKQQLSIDAATNLQPPDNPIPLDKIRNFFIKLLSKQQSTTPLFYQRTQLESTMKS